ncbi:MAG TPA: Flp family type IVb pilin [Rhodospirillaceae bacterium]|nr:Flp family type IVb pilin [Rhodospirillaceae bacterium]
MLLHILDNNEGATAIEYAMIVAFIAVAIVTVLTLVGTNLESRFQAVVTAFSG